jgi:GT2 family glycosyltransferase
MNKDEKIAIAVCDSGKVEGSHSAGIHFAIMNKDINHHFKDFIRSKGIKIATQRQEIFNTWMLPDFDHTDWLLWLDSDIEVSYSSLKSLLDSADKDNFPVVSGLYFTTVSTDNNGLPVPHPCFFRYDEETKNRQWWNLDLNVDNEEAMIKAESVGFGMLLIHRSIAKKLVEHFGNKHLFLEIQEEDHSVYYSEDIVFCLNLKEIGIPIYVNTKAIPAHWKTIPLDNNYYKFYHENISKDTI